MPPSPAIPAKLLQPPSPGACLTRVVGEVRLLLFDHHPRPWVPVPIDSSLAHRRLACLFVQGVQVFLLEALRGVGWAGLRQLVWVGGWEGFPAPSLGGCEGVANIQGLLEDRAGCVGQRRKRRLT